MKLNAALGRWTSSFPANRTMYFSDTDSRGSHQFWPWLKIFAWSARGAGEHMFILPCSYCTFAWCESGSSRMHWFGRNSYICCMVVSSPNYNLKCVEKRGLVFGKQFAVVLAAQWKLAWKCSWLCFAKDTWWIPRSFRMIALCWVLPVWLSLICNPNRICERCGLAIAKVNSILTAALAPLQTCFEFYSLFNGNELHLGRWRLLLTRRASFLCLRRTSLALPMLSGKLCGKVKLLGLLASKDLKWGYNPVQTCLVLKNGLQFATTQKLSRYCVSQQVHETRRHRWWECPAWEHLRPPWFRALRAQLDEIPQCFVQCATGCSGYNGPALDLAQKVILDISEQSWQCKSGRQSCSKVSSWHSNRVHFLCSSILNVLLWAKIAYHAAGVAAMRSVTMPPRSGNFGKADATHDLLLRGTRLALNIKVWWVNWLWNMGIPWFGLVKEKAPFDVLHVNGGALCLIWSVKRSNTRLSPLHAQGTLVNLAHCHNLKNWYCGLQQQTANSWPEDEHAYLGTSSILNVLQKLWHISSQGASRRCAARQR